MEKEVKKGYKLEDIYFVCRKFNGYDVVIPFVFNKESTKIKFVDNTMYDDEAIWLLDKGEYNQITSKNAVREAFKTNCGADVEIYHSSDLLEYYVGSCRPAFYTKLVRSLTKYEDGGFYVDTVAVNNFCRKTFINEENIGKIKKYMQKGYVYKLKLEAKQEKINAKKANIEWQEETREF